jgi:hypothetical protein
MEMSFRAFSVLLWVPKDEENEDNKLSRKFEILGGLFRRLPLS